MVAIRRRLAGTPRLSVGNRVAVIALCLVTAVAVLARAIAPHPPDLPVGNPFQAPNSHFLFGTDEVGRDLLSRVLVGFRTSWLASLEVIVISVAVGSMVGLLAGSLGGFIDSLLMRVTDVFLALPGPMLAIAVVAALGPSLDHTLMAVLIVWWPFYARIVRGEVKALAARPHVDSAVVGGASRLRVLWRHLLPGALPTILVTASLDIGNVVLALAGLSFLGLGAPSPAPELGAMAARGMEWILQNWWIPVIPSAAVFLMAATSNLAGDGLRDLVGNR